MYVIGKPNPDRRSKFYTVYWQNNGRWQTSIERAQIYPTREDAQKEWKILQKKHKDGKTTVPYVQQIG